MKHMLLIHQGTTPTPLDPEAWATLPEDEQQAIYAAYKAVNETPGVTPGNGLQPPETWPVVELNRAVAIAEAQGAEAGLAIVDRLALEDYRYLHSTRGELLRRLGRTAEARDAYLCALALVHDDTERRLLERLLAELEAAPGRSARR
jgi:RNA polymerase sigma-70 factor (ECF subfamily)